MSKAVLLKELRTSGSVLEIGPGANPLFAGEAVEYLDVLDAETLRRRFADEFGIDVSAAPKLIQYVGALADVTRRFDLIASSHNIEHHPDLVGHLSDVAQHLNPGGRFFAVIPDKRYCFDHFIPESTIADVVGAYLERRTVHSAGKVVEHRALTTHNDPIRHWARDHGAPGGIHGLDRLSHVRLGMENWRAAAGGYVDVHAWQFTPTSFAGIVSDLSQLGLSSFRIEKITETAVNDLEFCVVLRLDQH